MIPADSDRAWIVRSGGDTLCYANSSGSGAADEKLIALDFECWTSYMTLDSHTIYFPWFFITLQISAQFAAVAFYPSVNDVIT